MKHLLLAGALALAAAPADAAGNDYPTAARADYVIGCMAANGEDQLTMQRCSCSIDFIAARVTYEEYVEVETMMRLQGQPGERAQMFTDMAWAKQRMDDFHKAQVEADLKCF